MPTCPCSCLILTLILFPARGWRQPDPAAEMPAAGQVQPGRGGHGVRGQPVPAPGRRGRLHRLLAVRGGRSHPFRHLPEVREGQNSF